MPTGPGLKKTFVYISNLCKLDDYKRLLPIAIGTKAIGTYISSKFNCNGCSTLAHR
jgi:hypothetical protein